MKLPSVLEGVEPVRRLRTPVHFEYNYTPGQASSRFLRQVAFKRLVGQRCPVCEKVYVPPRGACPVDGVPTADEVELAHEGFVKSFCVVNVQFYGQAMECPYVSALIVLDGADIPIMHLIQEIPADQVTIGMRVEAVWVEPNADGTVDPSLESIKYFRPVRHA